MWLWETRCGTDRPKSSGSEKACDGLPTAQSRLVRSDRDQRPSYAIDVAHVEDGIRLGSGR